jgi:hypothetical protein
MVNEAGPAVSGMDRHRPPVDIDWTEELAEQLEFQWSGALRPRIATITDEAYLWEPVDEMWSIRRRADARCADAAGAGDVVIDFEFPQPDPEPLTTIAWPWPTSR